MNIWKFVAAVCSLACPILVGCNTSDPTSAVLVNAYAPASEAGVVNSMVVYKGWWSVAQFLDPVAAGEVSAPVRVVPGRDYGYALLAPEWDPTSGTLPAALIPLRSAQQLDVARGETLTFTVSDQSTVGNCAAGLALAQEDADFITQRIFPGEFANAYYDAALCTSFAASSAGGDSGAPGESSAGGQAGSP